MPRRDEDKEMQVISRAIWLDITVIEEAGKLDSVLAKILWRFKKLSKVTPMLYTLDQNSLYYKGRLVLSASSPWVPKFLHEFYTTSIGGHLWTFRYLQNP